MSRQSHLPLAPLAATALVPALAFGLAAPAAAQSLTGSALEQAVISSNADPGSSGDAIDATLTTLDALGSSEVPVSSAPGSSAAGSKLPVDRSIVTPAIVDKQVEGERLERWTVASPAMMRNVEVQIMGAADSNTPAPMLYLLDGVGAPRTSWWLSPGIAPEVFADENVTLVMPTQAQASMYADWQRDDPTLGRHQWETFITSELAPLLEAEPELNFNGHRGIGGLSMGATGAIHIANRHPELFDAALRPLRLLLHPRPPRQAERPPHRHHPRWRPGQPLRPRRQRRLALPRHRLRPLRPARPARLPLRRHWCASPPTTWPTTPTATGSTCPPVPSSNAPPSTAPACSTTPSVTPRACASTTPRPARTTGTPSTSSSPPPGNTSGQRCSDARPRPRPGHLRCQSRPHRPPHR
ncbi:alpha/beta hydrolase-fold protein [Corynebacterium suedekumii]|nr:alpha/beta hydrolase-fold protein [Corynebacterium suedekumii]